MDIYTQSIKKDMPMLIEQLRNAKNNGPYHDKEQEILENFLDDRFINASVELIEKINNEIRKELPGLPFIYTKTYAQFESQLERESIKDIDERRDSMLNLMKKMTNARTTSYFRDYAIAEIKIAYRLKEYLTPDEMFPPKDLNNVTKVLLENNEYEEAIRRIMDKELYIDLGCSSGYESLVEEAVEFAKNLVMKKNLENNEEKYDVER